MTKHKLLKILVPALSMVLLGLLLTVLLLDRKTQEPPAVSTTQVPTTETTLPPPTENVFTPLDFGYEGDYLTCLTAPSILGVDVSSYQRDVDWEKVKEAGVEFVMIRAGFRGYGEAGILKADSMAAQNYEKATAAGLRVGVYFFSQATSVAEAEEEANFLLEIIDGWQLTMPVAYDWECLADDYRTVDVDSRTVTDCAIAFCQVMEAAGFDSMVYFNPSQSRTQMHLEELVDYGFWLAMYSESMTYEYKVDMWQYTNQGAVPGIKGKADINLYFPYENEEEIEQTQPAQTQPEETQGEDIPEMGTQATESQATETQPTETAAQ